MVGPKSIHFKTFGCQMNVYDSDRMKSRMESQGFVVTPSLRDADVIVINTCSIREKSEQKVFSLLGELKPLKKRNPDRVIAVCGCVAQRAGRALLQKAPHLDLVFGPDRIDEVGDLVRSVVKEGRRVLATQLDGESRQYSQPWIVQSARPTEFVTVMKGCDHFCTYCIVPFVRGREKSRAILEIVGDIRNLVASGTKEVTFLGQNINTYGKGTGETLSQLIIAAHSIEGLERIRYVTSHPRDLGEDLMQQFGFLEKLCPALHLPFQSGSDGVLKRMSRLYTQREYLQKIEKLRNYCPSIALSTDVIVGFPGEMDEDFEKTLDVMKQVRFSSAFLFKYSPRPGTRAHSYTDEVPESIKEARLKALQDIAFSMILEENRTYIGKQTPVLIESIDKKGQYYFGRNPYNKVVHVFNAGPATVGKTIPVEITEVTGSNLKGFFVGAPYEKPKNSLYPLPTFSPDRSIGIFSSRGGDLG